VEERAPAHTSPQQASIVIIGLGGTGSALLPLLVAVGAQRITLIDGDTVEQKNLSRQLTYAPQDVGRAKVVAAKARFDAHSTTTLVAEFRFIDQANCAELLHGSTVVADCTDDLLARQVIDSTCAQLGVPLVCGAVHGMQVQVTTRHCAHLPSRTAPFFNKRPAEEQEGCDMQQVPAAVTTVTAALMALRIQDILHGGHGHAGMMDLVDVEHGRWMRIMGPTGGELMDTPIRKADHV
jgi:adenylyltransferase/sulfurtransferase